MGNKRQYCPLQSPSAALLETHIRLHSYGNTALFSAVCYIITPSYLTKSELGCCTWLLHQINLSKRKNKTVITQMTTTYKILRIRNIIIWATTMKQTSVKQKIHLRSLYIFFFSITLFLVDTVVVVVVVVYGGQWAYLLDGSVRRSPQTRKSPAHVLSPSTYVYGSVDERVCNHSRTWSPSFK